jgi:para-aminobenzoate synthetase / 4-amino-4-deoxychorismate lyase
MSDFQLIETMRVSETGEVYLLERHLERLSNSARYFAFTCNAAKVREEILHVALREARHCCLRLTLGKDGTSRLDAQPLSVGYAQRLKLSSVRVHSSDVFLYHKTTKRGIYDEARRECDLQTDAILINEHGEITETTIMNIAVFRDGRWLTPPGSCGLLRGVMREELLAQGEIVEAVTRADELRHGESIRCFNALRGVRDVPILTKEAQRHGDNPGPKTL